MLALVGIWIPYSLQTSALICRKVKASVTVRLMDLLIIVRNTSDMDTQFADKIISSLEQGYDRIADHFSQTRLQPWPEFSLLEPLIQPGSAVLDVGCGNGRLAEFTKKIKGTDYTGTDLSGGLLRHAQKLYPDDTFVQASMLSLPFPDQQFDVVVCVAALLHIPSEQYRIQALREMYRVAKPGATLFMVNWNLYQDALPDYFAAAKTDFGNQWEAGDALIPWKNPQGEILAQRYYHGFTIDELNSICKTVGWNVEKSELGETTYNIVTVCKK